MSAPAKAARALRTPEALPAEAPVRLPTRQIGRMNVAVARAPEIVAILARRLEELRFTRLAFANAHCVNVAAGDAAYAEALDGFLVLADGVGVDIASKVLYGAPFPQNLNGTDFVPLLLASLARPQRVALVGGAPGTAQEAAEVLAAVFPMHTVRAVSDGYFRDGLETEIVRARLRDFSPDITLVALGVPKQEMFVAASLTLRETTLAIGVGALFDFLAGNVSRAPRAWRMLRLEWLYRLFLEPKRLWRRYVLGNPRFLLRVFAERLSRRRGRA